MIARLLTFASLAIISCSSFAGHADPGMELAGKFGALGSVLGPSLSPDGTKIIFLTPTEDGGRTLFLADIVKGGMPKVVFGARVKDETVSHCSFASNRRIICRVYILVKEGSVVKAMSRLVLTDLDGKNAQIVGENDRYSLLGNSILDWNVPGKPGHILVMAAGNVSDLDTDKGVGVFVGRLGSTSGAYISDGHGNIRISAFVHRDASGYFKSKISWLYRKVGASGWDKLVEDVDDQTLTPDEFWPEAVDGNRNLVYGFGIQDGRQALFSMTLDGAATRQMILSRPDVDVDQLIRIGRSQRVVGASYATDRRVAEFFDPELKRLAIALTRSLPGNPSIRFIDASEDESKLLLFASSDVDPGMFYLYDKATRHLEQLLPARDELAGVTMGRMQSISFTAADGTSIPSYLTLPPGSDGRNLPAIVMPHGGPSARDEWGFDWLAQYFALRGYAVIQPNFRGSSGYGADWYQKNGFQSWKLAVGDVNDAARYLLSQKIAAPGKVAILGWSYGGYAALQSSVLDPDLFKAIVAISPVTDLDRLRQESHNFVNYLKVDAFIGRGPHVKEGSPAQNASVFKAPVMLFHGDRDLNVSIEESRLMQRRLKDAGRAVTLVEFSGLDHQLASAKARSQLLAQSDVFIRKALGLPVN